MARQKLAVPEVFILQEVLPYEGSEIIDVFTTPEAAMDMRPGRWKKVTNDEGTYWTTRRESSGRMDPWFVINSYTVRSK